MTVDADGNVVSVSVVEPRFTPREKALLIAAMRALDAPRGKHGILLSEATNPDVQWEVDLPSRDYVQQAIDREQRAYLENYGDAAEPNSLLWRPRRRQVTSGP